MFKRDGYGLFKNLPIACSTCAVHGGYHFQQVGGNDVQLWGNNTELAASVNDASFVKIASGTLDATWQCADSQGFAYCLPSSRDTCVKTDGSSANTSFQSSVPLGTMVTFTPLQMIVAGVSGNESTLYISGQNTFTTFTIGTLPSSPFTEPIASPGSRITHIAYYFGKLFWWKDQSFGYATFTNQSDWQLTIVSNQIGTLDNSDAFWNSSGFDAGSKFTGSAQANAEKSPGGIFFRGQDNHIYVYDGYYLTRLSRVISPTVSAANRRKANLWAQSSAADFNAGSFSNTAYSSITNGVWVSTTDTNILNNSFESGTNWTFPGADWQYYSAFPSSAQDCTLNTAQSGSKAMNYYITDAAAPSGYNMSIKLVDANSGSTLSSLVIPYTTNSCTWTQRFLPAISTAAKSLVYITAKSSISGSGTLQSDSFAYSGDTVSFYTAMNDGGFKAFFIDNFQNGRSTGPLSGIYYSSVHNAPSLTTWGTFSGTTGGTGGSHSFFVRSSTNIFTIQSSTPAWVSQTNNSNVAASTGTYFQFSDTFTIVAATETPTLTSLTMNWFEGSASDKAYIAYFNDAIWFSVSSGASSSTNNKIFYWDILNGAWLIYDIPSNGFLIENNNLYFGDPAQGRVFQFGGVSTDNAGAINSYWRSKAYLGSDPFVQNEFQQADFILGQASTTVNYTYTLDSKTSTVFGFTTYDSAASLIQRNFLLPVGKIGKYYDFKLGNNDGLASWRLMAHKVHFNPLNWKPVLQ